VCINLPERTSPGYPARVGKGGQHPCPRAQSRQSGETYAEDGQSEDVDVKALRSIGIYFGAWVQLGLVSNLPPRGTQTSILHIDPMFLRAWLAIPLSTSSGIRLNTLGKHQGLHTYEYPDMCEHRRVFRQCTCMEFETHLIEQLVLLVVRLSSNSRVQMSTIADVPSGKRNPIRYGTLLPSHLTLFTGAKGLILGLLGLIYLQARDQYKCSVRADLQVVIFLRAFGRGQSAECN